LTLRIRDRLGILTGNLEGVARLKLTVAGVERFFSFGAYGSDSRQRADLPVIARTRWLRAGGRAVSPRREKTA
jgi:hypothetical protein